MVWLAKAMTVVQVSDQEPGITQQEAVVGQALWVQMLKMAEMAVMVERELQVLLAAVQ